MDAEIIAVKSGALMRFAVISYIIAAALAVAATLCGVLTEYPVVLAAPAVFAAAFAALGTYLSVSYARLPYALITYDGEKLAFATRGGMLRIAPDSITDNGGECFGTGYACSKCNVSAANSGYSFGEYKASADGTEIRVKWCKDITAVTRRIAEIVLDAKERTSAQAAGGNAAE